MIYSSKSSGGFSLEARNIDLALTVIVACKHLTDALLLAVRAAQLATPAMQLPSVPLRGMQ